MKSVISTVLFAIVLLIAMVIFGPDRTSAMPEGLAVEASAVAGDGPAHPGWYAQWYRMRKNEQGIVPPDYLKNIYLQESERWSTQKTTAGLLNSIAPLGPDNVGGRTRALIVDMANHDHLLAGGISGGIWQSFDRGITWTPTNDQAQSMAVTYLSQDPNQPADIYYTTGEVRGNSAGISGGGVFKSTDGGVSFNVLPATTGGSFDRTWRVQVSPVEPGRVYVATRNDGLQLSTDGGASFNMVFGFTGAMEVSDVEVFADSSVLIGVRTQGVFYSPNGNQGTFVQVSSTLPGSGFRRVELAYCDSMPNVVYALFEDGNGSDALGLWKSTDQGQNWVAVTNPENTINFSFPWYCMLLTVQPDNPNFVIAAGQQIAYTNNGGTTWTAASSSHADYHSTAWDRDNPVLAYIGNDGGVWKYSTPFMNGSPSDLNDGYSTTQFYAGAYFPQNDVMGGTQDNGTHVSRSGNSSFDKLMGGDGAYCAVNQQNPGECYASYQNGIIRKSNNAQSTNPNFSTVTNQLDGDSNGSIDEGAWFINPFDINLEDGNQLYYVTQQSVWRTTDGADNWSPITNDIRNGNNNPYCVGISRDLDPTVYVGGESGLIYRIDNATTAIPGSEVDLSNSVPGSVTGHFIACIQVHPEDASVIYVTFTTVSSQSRIWKVTGANTNSPVWTSIAGDLPASLPVNWVAQDPANLDSVLLAATDYGLYTSTNAGQNWILETDIPNSPVFQVKVRDGDRMVYAFTHGRGIWTAGLPALPVAIAEGQSRPMRVYPNPAQDELRVDLTPDGAFEPTYQVLGMQGQILAEGLLGVGNIDIRGLSSGSYFLRLIGEQNTSVARFVKQ
jgi:photosystem II stability/assembly factor-like uncharacterized protein